MQTIAPRRRQGAGAVKNTIRLPLGLAVLVRAMPTSRLAGRY